MDTLWLSNCAGTHPRYSFLYPHPFLNAVACQKKNYSVLLQNMNMKAWLCIFVLSFFDFFFLFVNFGICLGGKKSFCRNVRDTFFKCRDAQTACLICLRQPLNLPRFPCSFLLEHFSCHIFSCCLSPTLKEQITPKSKGHISLFFSHSSIYPSRLFWMEWL